MLLAACGLFGRAVYVAVGVNSDTAMFVYQGKVVAEGGRMGIDLLDNKLPSVGLLMSVPWRAIGAAWWGYAVVGFALSIIASLFLARAARRHLGDVTYWPVLIASMVWLNMPPLVYGQLQLETIQIGFISVAAACAMELLARRDWRDAVTAGLCIGTAMWAKPTAGAIGPAIVAAILFGTAWTTRQKIAAIIPLAVGVLVPLVLCGWLIVLTGMAEGLPATIAQLRDYSANSTADWMDAFKPIFMTAVMLFPAVVLKVVFRRDRVDPPTGSRRAIVMLLIGWFLMELVGVVSQRRMYAYHFLVLAPPMAMITGLVTRRPRAIAILFAFAPAALLSAAWGAQAILRPDINARTNEVAAYLREHASPEDRVWADDYPLLLIQTGLRPASSVPLTFLFGNSDEAPLTFGRRILDDFARTPPRYVVLYNDVEEYIRFYQRHMAEIAAYPRRAENFATAWRAIDAYVRRDYDPVEQVGRSIIYRRRDAASVVQAD